MITESPAKRMHDPDPAVRSAAGKALHRWQVWRLYLLGCLTGAALGLLAGWAVLTARGVIL